MKQRVACLLLLVPTSFLIFVNEYHSLRSTRSCVDVARYRNKPACRLPDGSCARKISGNPLGAGLLDTRELDVFSRYAAHDKTQAVPLTTRLRSVGWTFVVVDEIESPPNVSLVNKGHRFAHMFTKLQIFNMTLRHTKPSSTLMVILWC